MVGTGLGLSKRGDRDDDGGVVVGCRFGGGAPPVFEQGRWPMTSKVAGDLRHPVLIVRAIPPTTTDACGQGQRKWPFESSVWSF
jgi:hypothetical protein